MKSKLIMLIGSFSFLVCLSAYAACGGDCQQSPCGGTGLGCQCADGNYNDNGCISPADYCKTFGNVGGVDDYLMSDSKPDNDDHFINVDSAFGEQLVYYQEEPVRHYKGE